MSSIDLPFRFIAAGPRSRRLVDLAIAVATLGGSLSLIAHGGVGPAGPRSADLDLAAFVLAACSTLPLIAWRRSPFGVFALTASAGVLLAGLGYRIDLLLGPAVALYLIAASREQGSPWTQRLTVTVIGLLAAFLGAAAASQGSIPYSELLHTGLAWAVGWFAGERTRLRREQIAELRVRAVRTEREAERERKLAVAEERARIARDLHDSAGHAINVIAVRAGAARLRHGQEPGRSLAALEAIEEIARQTAEDIDHIVGGLRDNAAASEAVEAPIGLASLDTLITSHRDAGLKVTLEASGTPCRPGTAADQATYRILQEALTNAARHGAGGARIDLAFGNESVELTVTNPVPASPAPPSARGHGLIGMRERATLLGGTLEAERDNGVFRVHATVPYGGHSA